MGKKEKEEHINFHGFPDKDRENTGKAPHAFDASDGGGCQAVGAREGL